jgi:hypothetical protein
MIGQKPKFDVQNNNNQLSVILKRNSASKPHVNLIINKEMQRSQSIQDSIITNACVFKVQESGYYHISSQICLINNSTNLIKTDFLQFGIVAQENMQTECKNNMKSIINATIVQPEYFISDSLTSVMLLEKDVDYSLWLNVGSESNDKLYYESLNSHCRLYKL